MIVAMSPTTSQSSQWPLSSIKWSASSKQDSPAHQRYAYIWATACNLYTQYSWLAERIPRAVGSLDARYHMFEKDFRIKWGVNWTPWFLYSSIQWISLSVWCCLFSGRACWFIKFVGRIYHAFGLLVWRLKKLVVNWRVNSMVVIQFNKLIQLGRIPRVQHRSFHHHIDIVIL